MYLFKWHCHAERCRGTLLSHRVSNVSLMFGGRASPDPSATDAGERTWAERRVCPTSSWACRATAASSAPPSTSCARRCLGPTRCRCVVRAEAGTPRTPAVNYARRTSSSPAAASDPARSQHPQTRKRYILRSFAVIRRHRRPPPLCPLHRKW